jgi:homoserine O-succinyltransferase
MPATIHPELPAYQTLLSEGVWVIPKSQANSLKDIPRLKIGLMNLMPVKPPTETQIFRMLGRSPVLVDITLFVPDYYSAKNTSPEYMQKFYKKWSEISQERFDGFILTGAPIEHLPFEQVQLQHHPSVAMRKSLMIVF